MWVSSTPVVTVLMLVVIGLLLSISAASPESSQAQAMPAYVPLSHSYPLRQPQLQQQLQPPTLVEEDPSTAESRPAPLGATAARLRAAAAAAAAKTAYPQRSTPEEAPWLFGAPGRGVRISKRGAEQLQMRKNSGYLHRDSAPPPKPGGATVLTGTAWHHGSAVAPPRCSERGTWSAPLRRCDCGPFAWGADCSVSVVTQTICVYNDSRPWFCDKPACNQSGGELTAAGAAPGAGGPEPCVGAPLSGCERGCSGRGRCARGVCACYDGYRGRACAEVEEAAARCLRGCSGRGACERGYCRCTPPYWGADCAMGGAREPRCSARPCI